MKNIYDYKHVKSVTGIALMYKGKHAGKIVCNWSDNRNGSVCTASVMIWNGPLEIERKRKVELMGETKELTVQFNMAKAGGYGYCKFSQAVGEALGHSELNGCGESVVQKFFEENGYEYLSIV